MNLWSIQDTPTSNRRRGGRGPVLSPGQSLTDSDMCHSSCLGLNDSKNHSFNSCKIRVARLHPTTLDSQRNVAERVCNSEACRIHSPPMEEEGKEDQCYHLTKDSMVLICVAAHLRGSMMPRITQFNSCKPMVSRLHPTTLDLHMNSAERMWIYKAFRIHLPQTEGEEKRICVFT